MPVFLSHCKCGKCLKQKQLRWWKHLSTRLIIHYMLSFPSLFWKYYWARKCHFIVDQGKFRKSLPLLWQIWLRWQFDQQFKLKFQYKKIYSMFFLMLIFWLKKYFCCCITVSLIKDFSIPQYWEMALLQEDIVTFGSCHLGRFSLWTKIKICISKIFFLFSPYFLKKIWSEINPNRVAKRTKEPKHHKNQETITIKIIVKVKLFPVLRMLKGT